MILSLSKEGKQNGVHELRVTMPSWQRGTACRAELTISVPPSCFNSIKFHRQEVAPSDLQYLSCLLYLIWGITDVWGEGWGRLHVTVASITVTYNAQPAGLPRSNE